MPWNPGDDWTWNGDPLETVNVPNDMLVRWLIGDTISTRKLVGDDEITAALTLQPVPNFAAAALADIVANWFSTKVDKEIGKTRLDLSQQVEQFRKMADRLRSGGAGSLPGGDGSGQSSASMFVGGSSISADQELRDDNDVVQSSVRVGRDDMPGTLQNEPRSPWESWRW